MVYMPKKMKNEKEEEKTTTTYYLVYCKGLMGADTRCSLNEYESYAYNIAKKI